MADVGVQAGIEALEEAVRSGILREVVSGSGHPASYGFAQELMRQVVLTELGEARRQVLSQRAASRIEREAVKAKRALLPAAEIVRETMLEAVEQGLGSKDWSALAKVTHRRAGLEDAQA